MKIGGELAGLTKNSFSFFAPALPVWGCLEFVDEYNTFEERQWGPKTGWPIAMSWASAIRTYWRFSKLLIRKGSYYVLGNRSTGISNTIEIQPKLADRLRFNDVPNSEEGEMQHQLVCGLIGELFADGTVDPLSATLNEYSVAGLIGIEIKGRSQDKKIFPYYLKDHVYLEISVGAGLREFTGESGAVSVNSGPGFQRVPLSGLEDESRYQVAGSAEFDFRDQTAAPIDAALGPPLVELFSLPLYRDTWAEDGDHGGTPAEHYTIDVLLRFGYADWKRKSDNYTPEQLEEMQAELH